VNICFDLDRGYIILNPTEPVMSFIFDPTTFASCLPSVVASHIQHSFLSPLLCLIHFKKYHVLLMDDEGHPMKAIEKYVTSYDRHSTSRFPGHVL